MGNLSRGHVDAAVEDPLRRVSVTALLLGPERIAIKREKSDTRNEDNEPHCPVVTGAMFQTVIVRQSCRPSEALQVAC